MPELPEVETVRADVSRLYLGQTLQRLTVTGRRTVRRHPVDLLVSLESRTLADLGRHGKYLLFGWDDGQVLVVHLRMSGQLLAAHAGEPTAAHTHAVFSFGDAGELRFVDPRTFGELFLAAGKPEPMSGPGVLRATARPGPATATQPRPATAIPLRSLDHLGPDALVADPAYLSTVLAGRRGPLKALLVDQRVLAGIGNIYADEICFDARLRPDRPGGSLRARETGRLATSVGTVLEAAIVARGSTLGDQQYRDPYGQAGRFQLQHKVYGRAGLPCLSCGTPIQRLQLGAKSAYLCRKCQR